MRRFRGSDINDAATNGVLRARNAFSDYFFSIDCGIGDRGIEQRSERIGSEDAHVELWTRTGVRPSDEFPKIVQIGGFDLVLGGTLGQREAAKAHEKTSEKAVAMLPDSRFPSNHQFRIIVCFRPPGVG